MMFHPPYLGLDGSMIHPESFDARRRVVGGSENIEQFRSMTMTLIILKRWSENRLDLFTDADQSMNSDERSLP